MVLYMSPEGTLCGHLKMNCFWLLMKFDHLQWNHFCQLPNSVPCVNTVHSVYVTQRKIYIDPLYQMSGISVFHFGKFGRFCICHPKVHY